MSPAVRERLAARQARIARIRKRVVTALVAVFIAAFSTIYVQMASGHDPALRTATKAKSTSVAATTSSSSSSSTQSTAPAVQPAPVTTRQS